MAKDRYALIMDAEADEERVWILFNHIGGARPTPSNYDTKSLVVREAAIDYARDRAIDVEIWRHGERAFVPPSINRLSDVLVTFEENLKKHPKLKLPKDVATI